MLYCSLGVKEMLDGNFIGDIVESQYPRLPALALGSCSRAANISCALTSDIQEYDEHNHDIEEFAGLGGTKHSPTTTISTVIAENN